MKIYSFLFYVLKIKEISKIKKFSNWFFKLVNKKVNWIGVKGWNKDKIEII